MREVVSQIRERGKVEHAYLGVHMQPITRILARTYHLPVEQGVLIAEVVPGSPADKAGSKGGDRQVIFGGTSYVLGGDIVTAADGEPVASPDDLRRLDRGEGSGRCDDARHPTRRVETNCKCHARAPADHTRRLGRPWPLPPGA